MRKVLEHILSEIVDHPEAIKLTEVNGDKTTTWARSSEKAAKPWGPSAPC
jgi:predicted RNA-binding protein YlqC (UPF0109 family)